MTQHATDEKKTPARIQPNWWNEKHDSGWDRVKAAFKRDWEQTKADFSSKKGHELNQDATDTLRQAAGKQIIPPTTQPNQERDRRWEDVEPAFKYGFSAHEYYTDHPEWNSALETKMEREWNELNNGRTWSDAKKDVRQGWDSMLRRSLKR